MRSHPLLSSWITTVIECFSGLNNVFEKGAFEKRTTPFFLKVCMVFVFFTHVKKKIPQVTCSKGHAQTCGESCDGENVVKAACSHQQCGDALLHSITVLLQQQHGGNNHCWRHSTQHKATIWKEWILFLLVHILLEYECPFYSAVN